SGGIITNVLNLTNVTNDTSFPSSTSFMQPWAGILDSLTSICASFGANGDSLPNWFTKMLTSQCLAQLSGLFDLVRP
ncbi:MAG TPA: hypothetical protein VFK80_02390, partial [Limnochordia bacterium]|nr:hypothetical protein [Limnochordia bacterium]